MSERREFILTASGKGRLETELAELTTVRRPEVAERIRDSKQFGELGENPEYEDAKNEQAFIEGRILEIKSILNAAHVIDDAAAPTDEVGLGSVVRVRDLDLNEEWDYHIVGSIEADPDEDRISNESPIGVALMGKKVGEEVTFQSPAGLARYKVVDIRRYTNGQNGG